MCFFTRFHFLCGCAKITIAQPCTHTSINVQGELFCRSDPHPHIRDGTDRQYADPTHGPGVCSNIHCKWRFGVLPYGMYEEDVAQRYGNQLDSPSDENDAVFDMSEPSRLEREFRWLQLLNPDQRRQYFSLFWFYGRPDITDGLFPRAYFSVETNLDHCILLPRPEEHLVDSVEWYQLNPRYMDAEQLRYVTGWLLPAEVTIPGDAMANGSSPHKPSAGPFKVPLAHACWPRPGICTICGRNGGDLDHERRQLEIDADNLADRR